jgi:hypothetical protein
MANLVSFPVLVSFAKQSLATLGATTIFSVSNYLVFWQGFFKMDIFSCYMMIIDNYRK